MQYLDANNLYAWAMCQHLTVLHFEWSEEETDDTLESKEDSEKRYILGAHWEYP